MKKQNKHMQSEWDKELEEIKKCVKQGNVLSSHILDRLEERGISIMDLVAAILQGEIVEGYDVAQYPNYRNPNMIRNLIGMDTQGRKLKIGVAIEFNGSQLIVRNLTTVFDVSSKVEYLVG
ncbi:DUF4258 domain-containing protein [Lysinibacillus sphaericus]|uniref:DUF4258 domain-containing protein n=1 Tax=Lysinibacillus sphaericus TaxID=1421 RepID=A0A6G9ZZW4_LYSSH|nr:DUF4258 domain-containing protein [Lysinibacillus sphaericus]QIS31268.1 hypothetical protein [Lysinibacillus sphaericus]